MAQVCYALPMTKNTVARSNVTVLASNVRPSACVNDSPCAVDVDVEVRLGAGIVLKGEVTLGLGYGDSGYIRYGMSDQWVSGQLLEDLRQGWDDVSVRLVLDEMEEEAARYARASE